MESPHPDPVLADALCFADMTTLPDRQPVEPAARLRGAEAEVWAGQCCNSFLPLTPDWIRSADVICPRRTRRPRLS